VTSEVVASGDRGVTPWLRVLLDGERGEQSGLVAQMVVTQLDEQSPCLRD